MKSRIVLLVGAVLLLAACASKIKVPEGTELARQNPVLWNYFWKRALMMRSTVLDDHGNQLLIEHPSFLAKQADMRVNHFLKETKEQLVELREIFEQAKMIRISMLDNPLRSNKKQESFISLKEPLAELADEANDLRKLLSLPFAGLDSKEEFRYRIAPGAKNEAFQREIAFLEVQLVEAERRITDYLFVPTHTVTIEALRGENMLINLYRVQKLSELLVKRL